MIDAIEKFLYRFDWCLSRLSAITVLATMIMVVFDVFCRYVFGKPLPWVYDLVSIYVINLILYSMASEVLRAGSHIELDLDLRLLPPQVWGALQALAWVAVGVALALTTWVAVEAMFESFAKSEVHPGLYEWPVWIEKGVVALGLGLLVLRIFVRCCHYVHKRLDASVFQSSDHVAAAVAAADVK